MTARQAFQWSEPSPFHRENDVHRPSPLVPVCHPIGDFLLYDRGHVLIGRRLWATDLELNSVDNSHFLSTRGRLNRIGCPGPLRKGFRTYSWFRRGSMVECLTGGIEHAPNRP